MSTNENGFGGDWTQEKLVCVRKYLEAYGKIFQNNPKAQKLNTYYIDAFAGTGYNYLKSKSDAFDDSDIDDFQFFQKGSAAIALEVEPALKNYLFIEKSKDKFNKLENLKRNYPEKSDCIKMLKGDANDLLINWCNKQDWRYQRAVVFLDPYGMQVKWQLLEAIAKTKAIDLLFWFPLGMGVMRMLPNRELPPQVWENSLTEIFGTDEWQRVFYKPKKFSQPDFFKVQEEPFYKEADFKMISDFMIKRLKTIFTKVCNNFKVFKNSKNVPMYLLCFASGNEKGAKTAIKIANDLLK